MKKRILIAEDEDNSAASLEFLMRNGGFETRVSRDGIAARADAAAFRPHLVQLDSCCRAKAALRFAPGFLVLDLNLPGMRGLDLQAYLNEHGVGGASNLPLRACRRTQSRSGGQRWRNRLHRKALRLQTDCRTGV